MYFPSPHCFISKFCLQLDIIFGSLLFWCFSVRSIGKFAAFENWASEWVCLFSVSCCLTLTWLDFTLMFNKFCASVNDTGGEGNLWHAIYPSKTPKQMKTQNDQNPTWLQHVIYCRRTKIMFFSLFFTLHCNEFWKLPRHNDSSLKF